MIIRSMSANFGCLDGETLELEPGLNIIRRPNESGKSTWCAFIRAMLYGIDTSARVKAGYLPDKLRYMPWSGKPMSGRMDIEAGGRELTLTRASKSAAAPMRDFHAVYKGTANPVPGLTGGNAGEKLTGAGSEVFRRSAFIGQGEAAVTGTAELERRIAAVVSTGEEDTSCSEALSRLRSWQNRRRSRTRTGAMPELEAALAVQERQLEKLSSSVGQRDALLQELEAANLEAEQLAESEKRRRAEYIQRLRSEAAELGVEAARLEAEYSKAVAARAEADGAAQAGLFSGMSPEEAGARAEAAAKRLSELENIQAGRKNDTLLYVFAALAVLCLGACFLSLYALIGAAIFAVLSVWRVVLASRSRKRAEEAERERRRLLREYAAADAQELRRAADDYARLCERAEHAAGKEEQVLRRLEDARLRRRRAEERLLEPPADAGQEVRILQNRCERLKSAISELGGTIAATGDPMAIESGILFKRERLRELEAQCEAIALASETLREADAELQNRFSPALSRRAAEYLSRLTAGRYTDVAVSRDFSVLLKRAGEPESREALYLSAGAADLMYLAVRLAIVDLTLPEADPCPIILDDALVNLDSERRAAAMDLLGETAEKRQVILFTCE